MKMNSDNLDIRQRGTEKLVEFNRVKEETEEIINYKYSMSEKILHTKEKHRKNGENHFGIKKNYENVKKIERISKHEIGVPKYNSTNRLYDDKIKTSKSGSLPEKVFQLRNSPLTDIFNEVNHVKTVYNVFVAILLILLINTAAHDILDTGTINLGITTIILGFGKFHYVIQIWLAMIASSYSIYFVHRFWAHQRIKFSPKTYQAKIWDYTWLIIFIIYQVTFIILPAQTVMQLRLPPPSSFIILMEQTRLIMKIHAFIRSTTPAIISFKQHTEKKFSFPEFEKFSYFMFAPTLIYQNNYPRTKRIRWRYVAIYFLEVILVIFYVAFLFERFVLPVYKEFGREPLNLRRFILNTFFNTAMPGIVIFLCGFYCLLHAWMNGFAELMRFGDRMFYKDWWNSGSYDTYYRTWNVVIHDWLYTYIYKDMYEIVMPRNKYFTQFFVFFISAIFHEYILSCALRFFYPVMFTFFAVIGFFLMYVNKNNASRCGNIFMWFSLCTGSGMMISFYAMEYFARINCPSYPNEILDFILPRSWHCYKRYNAATQNLM